MLQASSFNLRMLVEDDDDLEDESEVVEQEYYRQARLMLEMEKAERWQEEEKGKKKCMLGREMLA